MVGCRYNAKNTLPKNYLYFAEKNGRNVKAEVEVVDVKPFTPDSETGLPVTKYRIVPRHHLFKQAEQRVCKQRHLLRGRDGNDEVTAEPP